MDLDVCLTLYRQKAQISGMGEEASRVDMPTAGYRSGRTGGGGGSRETSDPSGTAQNEHNYKP